MCVMLICFILVTMFELDQSMVFEIIQEVRNGMCKGYASVLTTLPAGSYYTEARRLEATMLTQKG
jgi:C4-dicarboxylate transporter